MDVRIRQRSVQQLVGLAAMPLLHGDEAYERKLRPLYDALDARSYKQAVKLADAVLKKYKGDQLARALKGYALHRSGKAAEALQLMRDIVAEGPEAERVVMTMAYTFKAAGQPQGITQAYVAAAERLPRDPEVLGGLFRSYVREFNFVKQQQTAMRLSKVAPAGSPEAAQCGWWVVCSLALQARAALLGQDQGGSPLPATGAAGLAPDKLLQLAETMAARQASAAAAAAAAAGKPGRAVPGLSYEGLLLYLDLLQGQGKAEAAAAALEGPLGAAVPLAADRLQLRAAALLRRGDLPAAAACYQEAVAASPDDWLSWQLYLDCVLPGSGDGSGGAPGVTGSAGGSRFPVGVVGGLADIWDRRQQAQQSTTADAATLASAEEGLRQLTDAAAGSDRWAAPLAAGTLRAPHLWRCELLLRKHRLAANSGDAADAAAVLDELATAVGDAFARLAGNFSCVSDLRPYLAVLSGPAAEQLACRAHALAAEANAAEEAAAAAGGGVDAGAAQNGASDAGNPGGAAGEGGSGAAAAAAARGVSAAVRRLQRQVSAHQLEAELGLPAFETGEQARAHAARLLALYGRHTHLSAGLDEKDRGYGEELVVMAVEALLEAGGMEGGQGREERQERRIAHMLQAVLVLEAAQQRRKVSAPLRLAAAALYSLLGAPSQAAAQLAALDIKSILHDSVTGHWLLPLLAAVLPTAGAGAEGEPDLLKWVEGCSSLHQLHQQEAGETLGSALEHGTYSKVPEFVDFKERLQHSHARALAAVLQALLPPRAASAAASTGPAAAPTLSLFPEGTASGRRAALQHARQLLLVGGAHAAEGEAGAAAAGSGPVLRFNEDLSTRPSWYPPGSAGSSSVAEWWDQADQPQPEGGGCSRRGYAHCWWAAPLSAESPVPEAAAWRARCTAELRVRLAFALAASASLDSAKDAAALLDQLQSLVGAGQAAAEGCGVQAAACRGVLALLQAVGGSADGLQAVSELAEGCTAAGKSAVADLAAAQQLAVLPGSVITAAAATVADCAAVAAVCSRLHKLAGKAQPAAAAAAGAAAAAADAATAEVKAAAKAVLAERDQQQRVEAALQAVVQLQHGSQESLWAFEPGFEAQPALAALVAAQAAVLQKLR